MFQLIFALLKELYKRVNIITIHLFTQLIFYHPFYLLHNMFYERKNVLTIIKYLFKPFCSRDYFSDLDSYNMMYLNFFSAMSYYTIIRNMCIILLYVCI